MHFENIVRMRLLIVGLLSGLLGVVFVASLGTGDTSIWLRWMTSAQEFGLTEGYKHNASDYPPFAHTILWFFGRASVFFEIDNFTALKLSLILFFITSCILFVGLFGVNYPFLLFVVLLSYSSLELNYIDIYYLPFMLLSFCAFANGRLNFGVVFLCFAIMTKWQPLITLPFVLIYIGVDTRAPYFRWGNLGIAFVIGSVVFALFAAFFGVAPILAAFKAAIGHQVLSGNALNLNWIITYFMHLFNPNEYGGLQNGLIVATKYGEFAWVSKFLFYIVYAFILLRFTLLKLRMAEDLFSFAAMGFVTYFVFNVGVHENHLFIPSVLLLMLGSMNSRWLIPASVVVGIQLLNLFVFYGLSNPLLNKRVLFGVIDATVPISVINVFLYLWLLKSAIDGFFDPRQSLSQSNK